MATTTYESKLAQVKLWAEITDYHWHRLKGVLHDDKEFWDDTLHAMTAADWWAWVDIEPAIRIQHSDHYRKFKYLAEDTKDIQRRLMLGKSVTAKGAKSQNFLAFRTLMAIHDLINDIAGTPTQQYDDTEPELELSPFERLFNV